MLKMTGLSRAQVTRLIGQHLHRGEVKETVILNWPALLKKSAE